MWIWTMILAVRDGGELYYIIAILILGIVGAIADKLKNRMGGVDRERESRPEPPKPIARPQAGARPARPRTPQGRPILREGPARAPAAPVRPPVRRPAPPPRRPMETPRRGVPDAAEPVFQRAPAGPPPARPAAKLGTLRPEPVRPAKIPPPPPPEGRPVQPHAPTPVGRLTPRQVARIAQVKETAHTLARPPIAEPLDVGSFRQLNLAEVRRAIVLNEILGPALALRQAEHLWDQ